MHIQNSSANSLNARRYNVDTEQSDKNETASNAAAIAPLSAQPDGNAVSSGQVLKLVGDEATRQWWSGGASSSGGAGHISEEVDADKLIDYQAATAFHAIDTDSPTLVTNQGGFNVNATLGPDGSSYIDLGNGAEIFVVIQPSGEQIAYRVENGELGDRLSDTGRTNIGNGIYVSIDESASGESEINFQRGRSSLFSRLQSEKMTLNSDNSMLTIKDTQSGFLGFIRGPEVNSFDIQSGQQLVFNGKANVDEMSPQQQFDYYADTPQGARILNVEGNFYQSDVEKRLLVARAQYLRGEGGPEVFNEFTPRRTTLSGEDLADYDVAVQDMMDEIREQGAYTQGVEGSDEVVNLDAPLDESMLYILASSAVEAYGESPEAMEAIQGDINIWKISTDNADGVSVVTPTSTSSSAGWYQRSTGTVQFNIDSLVNDFTRPDDQFELVTHELAHSLDNVGQAGGGRIDGIPPNLSPEDTEMLIAERERLFELAYPGEDVNSAVNQDHNTVADNSGFRNYAFRNRQEFWAELSATFLGSDAGAEVVKRASPELYNIMREYFNRDDLPAA